MHASLATTLLLATTALASPLSGVRSRAAPSTSTSKAFTLVANITSPSTISTSTALFGSSVAGWSLIGVHVGAGLDTAVLNSASNDIFLQNATSPGSSSLVAPISQYPYGFTLSEFDAAENDAGLGAGESEFYVGVNVGTGTPGVSISSTDAKVLVNATAAMPAGVAGSFVVCNETQPAYGRPQYPVRFVAAGEGEVVVPTECVAVSLLAQCAAMPALPADAWYNYDSVTEVPCYESVAGIDWSQAS